MSLKFKVWVSSHEYQALLLGTQFKSFHIPIDNQAVDALMPLVYICLG